MQPVVISEILQPIRRHFVLITVCAVLAGLAAFLYAASRPASYKAEAQILLKPDDPAEQLDGSAGGETRDRDRYAESQRAIIASESVLAAAAESLGVDELVPDVTSSLRAGTDVMSIFASDSEPVRARDTANAVAFAYLENRRQDAVAALDSALAEVDAQLAAASAELDRLSAEDLANPVTKARFDAVTLQYERLLATAQQLEVNKALQRGSGELIVPAGIPDESKPFGTSKTVVGAAVLGAALGIAAAVLMSRYDTRLRSRRDVERVGLRMLATVPSGPARRARNASGRAVRESTAAAEAYRSLRSVLQFLTDKSAHRSVAVVSVERGPERSHVAANLAVSFARAGLRTLLVASDLRNGALLGVFGQDERSPGLSDVLTSMKRHGIASVKPTQLPLPLVSTFERDLWLLPPGSPSENPAELLASPALREIAGNVTSTFEMVVYDTSPLSECADSALVARCAGGVVLAAISGVTTSVDLRDAKDVFDVAGVPILGVVLVVSGRRSSASRRDPASRTLTA
jgi:capsular exopolysaccharide synthesis family protein